MADHKNVKDSMAKNRFHEYILPVITFCVISAVIGVLLAVVNALTAPVIAERQKAEAAALMRELMPDTTELEVLDLTEAQTAILDENRLTPMDYYVATLKDNDKGYAMILEVPGYGDNIRLLVAARPAEKADDGLVLCGIRILAHSETPELGSKITHPNFYEQFNGVRLNQRLVLSGQDKSAGDVKTIDAIVSATVSSRAVVTAVQAAVDVFNLEEAR